MLHQISHNYEIVSLIFLNLTSGQVVLEGRENQIYIYMYFATTSTHRSSCISLHTNNNFVSKNKKTDNWLNYFCRYFYT